MYFKQGLNLIGKIVESGGNYNLGKFEKILDDNSKILQEHLKYDDKEAFEIIKKKNTFSVYMHEFGDVKEKDLQECKILQFKKFSDIPFSSVLNVQAKKAIDLAFEKSDNLIEKAKVLRTVRSLFAVLNTHSVANTTYKYFLIGMIISLKKG